MSITVRQKVRQKPRTQVRLALLLTWALVAVPLLSSACVLRPAPLPPTGPSTGQVESSDTVPDPSGSETSGTADPTGTGTGYSDPSGASSTQGSDPTGSDSTDPNGTSGTVDPTGPSGTADPTGSTGPSGSEPGGPTGTVTNPGGSTGVTGNTGTSQPGTTAAPTPPVQPGTTAAPIQTTVRPTNPFTPTPTPTQATTTRAAPTPTTIPTTTQATTTQGSSGSFPVRNYGTFFRNEYGQNANIVNSDDGAVSIDIGCSPQGVALVKVNTSGDDKRWKSILKGPSGTYQYDLLKRGSWEGVPLQLGNGSYTLTVYEQVSGTSYSPRMAHTFSVSLASSLSPYLAASIIVNFSSSSPSTTRAASLVSGKSSQVARIEAVYLWIVQNISYDRALAASITSGQIKTYIPNPDTTMSTRKGICYDYAALMAAMLRSQGIPTRLIMGQVSEGYHAWNEVYIAGTGWVVIASFNYREIDGSAWVMFDSTFAASGRSSQQILNSTHTKERTY